MTFLNQTNFPRLFSLFQQVIGGTADKRRLATKYYKGQKKILEIGCSVGNVSQIFSKFKQVEFTGIDIDNNALDFARKRFRLLQNFKFRNIALSDLAKTGEKFEYVLFANILHHVDDETALILLKDVQLLLLPGATLIVMEPEKMKDDYNLIFKFFYRLEHGNFRRHKNELTNLINTAGLSVKTCSDVLVSSNFMPFLKAGRITLIEAAMS